MTKYRVFACDLDETLLNDDHLIPQENIAAIRRAKEEYGLKFVPATGRGYMTVQRELKWLGLYDLPNEYVLSYNGGAITENKGNRILFFQPLPFEKVEELAAFGKSYDVGVHIYTPQMIYVYRLNEDEKRRKDGQGAVYTVIDELDLHFLKNIPVAKVLFQKTDMPYLRSIYPDIAPLTNGSCAVTYSSGRYMEINAKGVDKGSGLKRLSELLHIPLSAFIAAGDHLNDLPMLRLAGLSACPSNAVAEVQALCDYTAKADSGQGAIAEILQRFIFT